MNIDILKDAIENTAKKYVKGNVKVKAYRTKLKGYFSQYTLQLDYKGYRTSYILHNQYLDRESYIMRVVSDLCINLAEITNRERDFFFKKGDK